MRRSMYSSSGNSNTPNKSPVELPAEAYIKSRIASVRSPRRSGTSVPSETSGASGATAPYVTPSWVTEDMAGALNTLTKRRGSQTDSDGSASPLMGNAMLPKTRKPSLPYRTSTTSNRSSPSDSPSSTGRGMSPEPRSSTPPRTNVQVFFASGSTANRTSPAPKSRRLEDSPTPAPRPKPTHLEGSPRASPNLRPRSRLEDSPAPAPAPRPKPAYLEDSPRYSPSPRSKARLEDSPVPAPRPKPAHLEGSPRGSPSSSPQLKLKLGNLEDSPIQAPLLDFPSSLLFEESPKAPGTLTRVDSDIRDSIPSVAMHQGIPASMVSGKGDDDLRGTMTGGRPRSKRNYTAPSVRAHFYPKLTPDTFTPPLHHPAPRTAAAAAASTSTSLIAETPPTPVILDSITPEATPSNSYFSRISIPQVTEESGLGLSGEKLEEVERVPDVPFDSPKAVHWADLATIVEEKQPRSGDLNIASPIDDGGHIPSNLSDTASSVTAVDNTLFSPFKDASVLKLEPESERAVEVVEVKPNEQDISEEKLDVEERAILSPLASGFEESLKKGKKDKDQMKTERHLVDVVSAVMDQSEESDQVAGIPSEDSSPVKQESPAFAPTLTQPSSIEITTTTKNDQSMQTDAPPLYTSQSASTSPLPQVAPALSELTDSDLRQAAQDSVDRLIESLQPEIFSIVDLQNKIALASLDGPSGSAEVMKCVVATMDSVKNLLEIMGAHAHITTDSGVEKL